MGKNMTYGQQVLMGIIDGSINSMDDIKTKVYSSKAKVPSTQSIIQHPLNQALWIAIHSSDSLQKSYDEFEKQPVTKKEHHKYLGFLLKYKTEIAQHLQDRKAKRDEAIAQYKMKWKDIISPMTFADVYGVIDQLFSIGVDIGERFTQLVSTVREIQCSNLYYYHKRDVLKYFQYDETSAEEADVELFLKLSVENSVSINTKTQFIDGHSLRRINTWLTQHGISNQDKALQARIKSAVKLLQQNGYEVILKQS